MDMDRPHATHTVAEDILYRVCCRDRPTRHDDGMAFFGGGTAVPLFAFSSPIEAMKALRPNG
jgi:hypothetical protein